jgi:hypothetical protein
VAVAINSENDYSTINNLLTSSLGQDSFVPQMRRSVMIRRDEHDDNISSFCAIKSVSTRVCVVDKGDAHTEVVHSDDRTLFLRCS